VAHKGVVSDCRVAKGGAVQTMQTNASISMSKPLLLPKLFKPIAGGPNLFDLPENEWRPWRAIFAKGFNAEHALSLVPGMVEETLIFRETLRDLAQKGDMFLLDFKTLRFTMDLIGKTILYDPMLLMK
jgi:cytochrome P450